MKYRLLKEIPNCNWKVGEVRGQNNRWGFITCESDKSEFHIEPHDIAVLVYCGFLEEVKEFKIFNNPDLQEVDYDPMDLIKTEPTINRFTEMPEEGTVYWTLSSGGHIANWIWTNYLVDKVHFSQGIWKDKASAEAHYQNIMNGN